MQPIISVIVPVYKAEKYLHRCVNSLLVQTFADFDIILVDDGSPDNSGVICDEYAQKDNRVKVIHKENGGVASARQCGIDNAVGEYTIHADPDDWVEPNMLQELYNKAKETDADMVICDYYEEFKNGQVYVKQEPNNLSDEAVLRELLLQRLHGSTCNKLIRKSKYTENDISFDPDIIRWEDLYIVCRILANTPVKIAYLNKAFYHYDQTINPNSIVRKTTMKGLQSQILFVEHFMKILPEEKFKKELYTIKTSTKELAYSCGLLKEKEIIELYSEVNAEYISSAKIKHVFKYSFSLFLRGSLSYKNSKRLLTVQTLICKIRRCIINFVRRIILYKQ